MTLEPQLFPLLNILSGILIICMDILKLNDKISTLKICAKGGALIFLWACDVAK